jgi:glutathione S-transferase
MTNRLFIGPKNYSSWSLRPWLALKWAAIPFEEIIIPLAQPGYGEQSIADVLAVTPNGTVPAFHHGDHVIWDTMAIAEWAAEQKPALWPTEQMVRAVARSATSEMHSGFGALRRDLPMNITRRCPAQPWAGDTARSIARIEKLWEHCRARYGQTGPWLFGERSIADAFFAPIATRFRTYSVPLSPIAEAYRDTVLSDASFLEWEEECIPDSWDTPGYPVIDRLYA